MWLTTNILLGTICWTFFFPFHWKFIIFSFFKSYKGSKKTKFIITELVSSWDSARTLLFKFLILMVLEIGCRVLRGLVFVCFSQLVLHIHKGHHPNVLWYFSNRQYFSWCLRLADNVFLFLWVTAFFPSSPGWCVISQKACPDLLCLWRLGINSLCAFACLFLIQRSQSYSTSRIMPGPSKSLQK